MQTQAASDAHSTFLSSTCISSTRIFQQAAYAAGVQTNIAQCVNLPKRNPHHACRYGKDITDKSTLLTTLRTNKAYANLTHPMKATPSGKWVPDFLHR
jgi:hypothetical protein